MSTEQIQKLRNETGSGIMDVKRALQEAGGDADKARDILRKRGADIAAKKGTRETREGLVVSYIHAGGKIGVLLKVFCETDFVARTKEFQQLTNDLAMHIAAMDPQYLISSDVPKEVQTAERKIYEEQFAEAGKSKDIMEKIIEGKMNKFAEGISLLEQSFVKDQDKKIKDVIEEAIAKLGENIQVGEFVRYEL